MLEKKLGKPVNLENDANAGGIECKAAQMIMEEVTDVKENQGISKTSYFRGKDYGDS